MKLTEEQLKTILERYSDMYHACVDAEKAGCLDIDGPLSNAFWMGFESVLSIIDPHDWISWYIHDNDMGAKGLKHNSCTIVTGKQIGRAHV